VDQAVNVLFCLIVIRRSTPLRGFSLVARPRSARNVLLNRFHGNIVSGAMLGARNFFQLWK